MSSLPPNTLYFGDNLPRLRLLPDESVDLVYLDPPFNSARSYNLLFKQHKGSSSPAQIQAFEDTWKWSQSLYEEFKCDIRHARLFDLMNCLHRMLGNSEMMAYLLMMGPRLMELHRILKLTGSLFLHCDSSASGYLRLLLDCIFTPQCFQNEITWKRTSAHSDAGRFGKNCDTIFFYSRKDKWTWNPLYTNHDPTYLTRFRQKDADGRLWADFDITAKGLSGGGYTYEYKGITSLWRCPLETMQRLDAEGRLHFTRNNGIRLKRYLDENKGMPVQCLWDDISPINSQAAERRGYPTQKPLALLERIIGVASNEGDVVLDPFCGCGTAVIQAARMNRRWIGIDITYLAIAEIIDRLDTETTMRLNVDYAIQGIPTDHVAAEAFFKATAKQNHKPFEMWAVSLVGGEPIEKKGGDRGIDGRLPLYDSTGALRWAMIQIKGGHLAPTLVRDFARVIERENAPFGMFLCLEKPTDQMKAEADSLGTLENFGNRRIPRLQILTIRELLEEKKEFQIPIGYLPIKDRGVGQVKPVQQTMGY